jgi:hypothetical protein
MFSHSYYTLVVWKQVRDGRNYAQQQLSAADAGQRRQPADGQAGPVALPGERFAAGAADGAALARRRRALSGDLRRAGHGHDRRLPGQSTRSWRTTPPGPRRGRPPAAFDRRCAGCHHGRQCPLPRWLCRRERRELLGARHERSALASQPSPGLQSQPAGEVAGALGALGAGGGRVPDLPPAPGK